MPAASSNYVLARSYDDFDELAAEAVQWDLDLRQLDAGEFHGEILQFGIENVHISEAKFGRLLKQQGTPPAGMRTLVVPGDARVKFQWRGSRIDGNSLMIFPRGAELAALSDRGFHVYTCSFPETLLGELAGSLEVPSLGPRRPSADVVKCDGKRIASLRNLLENICARLSQDQNAVDDARIAEQLTFELPQMFLTSVITGEPCPAGISAARRRRVLGAAEDFILSRSKEPITVQDVSTALDVSLRTLQYAFSDGYGISPKRYIQGMRLNLVHKALKNGEPAGQKIADIANRYGFWHMGQFAADYRKHFGELPSETARRRNS